MFTFSFHTFNKDHQQAYSDKSKIQNRCIPVLFLSHPHILYSFKVVGVVLLIPFFSDFQTFDTLYVSFITCKGT